MGLPGRGRRRGVKNDSNIVHRTVLSRPLIPSLLFFARAWIPIVRRPVQFRIILAIQFPFESGGWKGDRKGRKPPRVCPANAMDFDTDKEILTGRGVEKSCVIITEGVEIINWPNRLARVWVDTYEYLWSDEGAVIVSQAGKNFLIKTYDRQLSGNESNVRFLFHFSLF